MCNIQWKLEYSLGRLEKKTVFKFNSDALSNFKESYLEYSNMILLIQYLTCDMDLYNIQHGHIVDNFFEIAA